MGKIVAIQGSYRANGLTTSMLKHAVKTAESLGHEVYYLNPFDKQIGYCKGCRKCLDTEECVFKNDDMVEITKHIKECDVIFLASPVYWGNMPGIVKNLFDRLSGVFMGETSFFPVPRMSGKRYIFFTASSTPMPFAHLCGQTSGIWRAVHEIFKTAGIKCMGRVICSNTKKIKKVSEKKLKRIEKLVGRI